MKAHSGRKAFAVWSSANSCGSDLPGWFHDHDNIAVLRRYLHLQKKKRVRGMFVENAMKSLIMKHI